MSAQRVSSPASTGGAGTVFEQHVGAYWLAQLLVRAIPPIICDCALVQLDFQTEHLGWHTDDFLVVGEDAAGVRRRLAGQVKRGFTVSASNDECKKAIGDFWRDFTGDLFSPVTDRFALVTLRGTDTLLQHFSGLLDCARSAREAADFDNRVTTEGFLSAKARHQCEELRAIISAIEGTAMTTADIWPLLRVLYVLSLDLATGSGQTEAQIKTMLDHTAGDAGFGGAEATWNDLVVLSGQAIAQARSFGRNDLPEPLRQRHSTIGGAEQRVLRSLGDHSALILRNISSTIGADFHLSRDRLVQRVLRELDFAQVVLVSGPAGSGKSAVAKDALDLCSADYFTFRHDTAARAGGGERLLEKSTRDAFSDLLRLAADDKSLRMVLTCRDYSTDLVRASFLSAARIGHSVVVVPRLGDDELAEVVAALPALARPLSHPALRPVLRNPYFLDKALQISWTPDRPLPDSEREFRALFWQQVVRAADRPADSAPRRREDTFEQIAVRRARALTGYVSTQGLDGTAVDSLRNDSLISSPPESDRLVAPAHDVLEDWAILRWIDGHYGSDPAFARLAAAIGTHPAIRRSYRTWVAEILERESEVAGRLFSAAVADADVPAQFRDDTLVSLLRAPSSPAFIERHGADLFADGKVLLRRVIHLLRVACVMTPAWLRAATAGSLLNVPAGPAWATVLRLVQEHLADFEAPDYLLLLGLIEDWARGVSLWRPEPDGAMVAAAIAYWLLPNFDTYREDGAGQRILKVIAKIPAAAATRFGALLRGNREDDARDRVSDTLREIVFNGLEGMPAARDVPQVVVTVARDHILATEADLRSDFYGSSLGTETYFGIKDRLHHGYFPASAGRGSWLPLLRYHPSVGLDFVIAVFNHSIDWYAHPRIADHLEPAFEVELRFSDGTSHRQWVNGRLWNLYRGTSVGPYVLQSILMALERWLFEVAEERAAELDAILLDILRRSDSGALTGVVAGVATRFPHAAGETLLVLLRSPSFIGLDRQRIVTESQSPSRLSSFMPGRSENRYYEEERKQYDALPHRRSDLESAIVNLQLGSLGPRVHQILDEHRAALPPADEQTESDRLWRLAMHRMDLREYTLTKEVITAEGDEAGGPAAEPQRRIRLDPNEPEPDVRQMVDESAARFAPRNERLGLALWSLKVFEGDESNGHDPARWRERLAQAQTIELTGHDESETAMSGSGPGLVAAVCVRDHWDEMSPEERVWCVTTVCAEITETAEVWDEIARMQRNSMSADRSCASIISLLLGKSLSDEQQNAVRDAFAAALTHPTEEVRWYAVHAIALNLWSIDRALTLRCINTLAKEATLIDRARHAQDERPYEDRRDMDDIMAETAIQIRERFWQIGGIAEDAYDAMDIDAWFGAEANGQILAILAQAPNDAFAIAAFTRSAVVLADWWMRGEEERRGRGDMRRDHRHEAETALADFLQKFVLQTTPGVAQAVLQPILDTVDRDPRDLHMFVRGLTIAEDQQPNTPQFWFVWDLFAQRIRRAAWVARVAERYATGDELISAIFLGSWWKEDVRHWHPLEGNAQRVDRLFVDLPPSSTVLDDYVRFLYHIGERSLPEAFVYVAQRLPAGNAEDMLRKTNTVFMLEVLLAAARLRKAA